MDDMLAGPTSIVLYESADHSVHLDVHIDRDTVWLNQQQLASLFGRDVTTIRRHIANARREELQGIPVSANFALTASDGKTYQVEHYNLDLILSVGYRVKSAEGVRFRRWANSVLSQHLLRGYTVNRARLEALGTMVKILERSPDPEISGAASLLSTYLPALELLDRYDRNDMTEPEGDRDVWTLTHEEALAVVRSLPFYEDGGLFGRERDGSFEGIINGLYQSFAGVELYPSVQKKAANLLYLIVKDHPFFDGNKRSAAALFVYFLEKNGLLHRGKEGQPLIQNNALAAITLMVALSQPSEKDTMIALVENLLVAENPTVSSG